MRVRTLGGLGQNQIAGVGGPITPSTTAVLSVIRGEPGGWTRVFFATLMRAFLIAPGVWLAGGKGWRLWVGAGTASTTVTVFHYFWCAALENERLEALAASNVAPPAPAGAALPAAGGEPTLEGFFGRRRRP